MTTAERNGIEAKNEMKKLDLQSQRQGIGNYQQYVTVIVVKKMKFFLYRDRSGLKIRQE